MIEIEHVSYTYPNAAHPALDDLTLTITEGEFLLVCGPSGAGKSSFLRLLNGLIPHFHGGRISGDVHVWGRSTRTTQPRDLADLVGFVFQDPDAQFVVDTVEDEIVFGMENLGLAPAIMRRRVEEVLDQLGIAALRHRRISSLSGGERQRIAIAAVLAAQPRALVLDEPTSQLDPHAAEEVLTALQKLNADLGLTIILSEHRLERVVQYADRILSFSTPPRSTTPAFPPMELSPTHTRYLIGPPDHILAQIDLTPPLVTLGKTRGWSPLPLTIKEGRRHARAIPTPIIPAPPSAPPTTPATITLTHVHYAYGTHEALYDLNITAHPGELLALMGRNGSGKTTLLRLLVGLLHAQRGTVRILGRDTTRLPIEEIAPLIGYVPQDPRTLLFHDTLHEELAFTLNRPTSKHHPTHAQHIPPHEHQIRATLDRLGLGPHASTYPRDLSGGEAQRAALAAVLVANPPILLLDEPTRGLDYHAKATLGRLLRDLVADQRTIIIATHDVELVAAYADRVALLGDGELIVEGSTRAVLGNSLIFSSQIAKLFPETGWLTVEDIPPNL